MVQPTQGKIPNNLTESLSMHKSRLLEYPKRQKNVFNKAQKKKNNKAVTLSPKRCMLLGGTIEI